MHPELVILAALDEADRAVAKAMAKHQRLQTAIKEARKAVQAAVAEQDAREEELKAGRKTERENHRRLEELRARRASAVRIQEQGLNGEAAQRQIDRCDELLDEAETEQLELMETLDAASERVAAAKALVAERQETQASKEAAEASARGDLLARIEAGRKAANEAREQLDKTTVKRYDGFRSKGRWAVAVITEKSCGGCRRVIAQQHLADIKRGLIKPCLGCSCWLVVPTTP